MFKIIAEPLVWWPVLFAGVQEDGAVVENKIELRFVILGEDEIDAFGKETAEFLSGAATESSVEGEAGQPVVSPSALSVQLIQRIARDWRGVAAENEEPLPFNAANLQSLLNVPNVLPAVLRAYGSCRAARPEIRSGN
ncbi:histidine kinase [Sphingobium aromaticiconvertens]|uniref:histidine kinase n=1 Tax=Sphingobium aromaticiconvertens TaxID=365341 RepID=UPI003017D233